MRYKFERAEFGCLEFDRIGSLRRSSRFIGGARVARSALQAAALITSLKGLKCMPQVKLCFEVKRGVVEINREQAEGAELATLNQIFSLCEAGRYDEAANVVRPGLSFEWSWSNQDGDADEMFVDPQDLHFETLPADAVVRIGCVDGRLVVSVSVFFTVEAHHSVAADELEEWLSENSCYAAGFVSGNWAWWDGWSGTDGDNVRVVSFDGKML